MDNVLIKEKIKSNFNKAASTYDQYCQVQNDICSQALTLLLQEQNHFSYIADFACGTGESTKMLLQHLYYKKCYAIDFAENLLAIAKKKLADKNIHFICSDWEQPLFKTPFLDLVFCNMGLQWAENIAIPISLFNKYLKIGGLLTFSIPLDHNFYEIKPPFKLTTPSNNSIIQILQDEKFDLIKFVILTNSIVFKNQYALCKYLKCLGVNYNNRSEHYHHRGLRQLKIKEIFINPENTTLTYITGIYVARKT